MQRLPLVSAFCKFLCILLLLRVVIKIDKFALYFTFYCSGCVLQCLTLQRLIGRIVGGGYMNKVLPVIIICAVGIALCLGYIVYLCVLSFRRRIPRARKRNEFEIEDDALVIKLGKKKK